MACAEELTMSQDDTPDLATPQAGKVAPEAVALRAQPRPVTRLNRRTLAILVGGLSVAVLGATIWSLQPQRRGAGEQTELYNVDRVSKSEGLDGLPADYSKLPPKVPELGPPLPGDLGPAIVNSQQPVAAYAPRATIPTMPCARRPKRRRLRRCSSARAAKAKPPRRWRRRGCAWLAKLRNGGLRPARRRAGLDGGPACRPDRRAEPARPERGVPESRFYGNPQFRQSALPASPYQVMAGTVIAGALVTGIKSDLPGDVIATVTEPVYDTATGKFLLIPQGSRILGATTARSATGRAACRWCGTGSSCPTRLR
jgi:type IV secretory pathway VirB10-like protein